jgi:RNA polymerase sigma factor for flagellar operon FliA
LVDWDDYVQSATEGMLQALERFEPNQGIAFEAYAGQRVRGAVFNQLRVLCDRQGDLATRSWALRWRERASMATTAEEGGLDAFVSVVVALGIGFLLENDVETAEATDPAYAAESLELTTAVRTGVKKLPEKERLIITLHYMNHVPFHEIAAQMGVTKGRVSQLHHQALGRLRQRLRPYAANGD